MSPEEKTSYLHRRNDIISVLDSLIGHWEYAEPLSALVGSVRVTPEIIDKVEAILREAIETTKDTVAKEKIQSGLNRIELMRKKELEERKSETSDIQDTVLADFIL